MEKNFSSKLIHLGDKFGESVS
ncbi:hypothetical protein EZS27_044211, partial [termite gut metagenome]